MSHIIDTIHCPTMDALPSIAYLLDMPRWQHLKIILNPDIAGEAKCIMDRWRLELPPNYVLQDAADGGKIMVSKYISTGEIDEHQDFFERCAKDYRLLASKLIFDLARKLKLEINEDFPLLSFNSLKRNRLFRKEEVNGWAYFPHGYDCMFEHNQTKQNIEVTLVFGFEFGVLDPYFFSKYINSSKAYHPLPISIYDDYEDGKRIIDRMIELGKFDRISSNLPDKYGAVVTDRDKIEVRVYQP